MKRSSKRLVTARSSKQGLGGFVAVAVCATAASSAAAATVPFTAVDYDAFGSFISGSPPQTFVFNKNSAPAAPISVTYANGDANGAVTAFASADLGKGQLKIQGSSSAPVGSAFPPYTQANAIFGDGFTTATAAGQPFAWTSSTNARFTFSLNGTVTSNVGGAPSSLNAAGGGIFLDLQILKPGTVNPDSLLVGAPTAIANYFYTFDGTTQQIYYTDPSGNVTPLKPTTAYDGLPSTITQDFTPGGDFDWTVSFGLAGQTSAGADYNIDLSHTLTIGYAAPAGAVTTDLAGLFTNITSLDALPPTGTPEPGGWMVAAIGLGCTMVGRARRG